MQPGEMLLQMGRHHHPTATITSLSIITVCALHTGLQGGLRENQLPLPEAPNVFTPFPSQARLRVKDTRGIQRRVQCGPPPLRGTVGFPFRKAPKKFTPHANQPKSSRFSLGEASKKSEAKLGH